LYLTTGAEIEEEEDFSGELPCHHSFDEEFSPYGPTYSHYNDANEHHREEEVGGLHGPHYLASAANMYLDTTVTKFLENDISVTKFLKQANDITVTKFLDATVTKFLEDNDISVTKFLS